VVAFGAVLTFVVTVVFAVNAFGACASNADAFFQFAGVGLGVQGVALFALDALVC